MCFHIYFSNFCLSSLIWYQYFVIRNVILSSQCVVYACIATMYIPIFFGACFNSDFRITIQNWENFPLQFEIKGRHCFHIVCIFCIHLYMTHDGIFIILELWWKNHWWNQPLIYYFSCQAWKWGNYFHIGILCGFIQTGPWTCLHNQANTACYSGYSVVRVGQLPYVKSTISGMIRL